MTIIKPIKKFYTMKKLINKIKIYQKCLIKNLDKNLNKYFNEETNNSPFAVDMLNLGNNSTDLIKVDKHENENLLKDVFKIDNQYKFLTDKAIIDSFQKVFQDYNVVYTPYKNQKIYM